MPLLTSTWLELVLQDQCLLQRQVYQICKIQEPQATQGHLLLVHQPFLNPQALEGLVDKVVLLVQMLLQVET